MQAHLLTKSVCNERISEDQPLKPNTSLARLITNFVSASSGLACLQELGLPFHPSMYLHHQLIACIGQCNTTLTSVSAHHRVQAE